MLGWRKHRDFQGRIDVTPWELGQEELPPLPPAPRVEMPLNGPRPLAGGAPQHSADIPAPGERRVGDEAKRLIVGRDIVLTGEIRACDRLVVEGRVEAALSDIRTVEITPTGLLKGAVQVDTADIGGSYEGDLTVQQRLHIRATGRVHGQIRYGSIQIERGGRIGGEVEPLAPEITADSGPEMPATAHRIQVDVDETEDEAEGTK